MNKKIELSCEVFPPKGEDYNNKINILLNEVKELYSHNLALISVTYGAGGSNRDNSLKLVKTLNDLKYNVMPHFTCVCSSKEFIEDYLKKIESLGIKNILALRGDEPSEIDVCYRDFTGANDLVKYIRNKTSFNIAVAGYPEKHPKANTLDEDVQYLKQKIDSGATKIYTQLFFDNQDFYNFREHCEKYKINVPIIAGIMPIISYSGLEKMTQMCASKIPNQLREKLEKYKEDSKAITEIGIEYASEQCLDLIKNEIDGFHFYALNKSYSTVKILNNIM